MFFIFSAVDPPKIIKPLRSLRLCGEKIHVIENPDTYLTAKLANFK
jgi:hypothetical protein